MPLLLRLGNAAARHAQSGLALLVVAQDPEGIQTLENLARHMAWLIKCIKAGRDAGIPLPDIKEEAITNFVR